METRKSWSPVRAGFASVLGIVLAGYVLGLFHELRNVSALPAVLAFVLAVAVIVAGVPALSLGLAYAGGFLVLRNATDGKTRWLSTRAVWAGIGACIVLGHLGAVACHHLGVGAADGSSAHYALIPAGLTGAIAGWITARLAPVPPIRHALAVALVWVLLLGLVTLVELLVGGEVTGSGLVARLPHWAIWLAGLLLGAWVGRRSAPLLAGGSSATVTAMED